ncbi:HVA22-like protein j [Ananas comosus]|uniref:HVA22-like protein j n=1 Tax=Ananas comosus TaxID=4615 RepID=A0A199W5V6_ANACO|nr:HVA22-like protein j [Ananas comosus]
MDQFRDRDLRHARGSENGSGTDQREDKSHLSSFSIIVAIVTAFERLGDGSDLVYDTFLRPLVMQYEPNIEQRLRHLRARSGQLLIFYIKNFTDKGTQMSLEVLKYVVSEKSRLVDSEVSICGISRRMSFAWGTSGRDRTRSRSTADRLRRAHGDEWRPEAYADALNPHALLHVRSRGAWFSKH